MDTHPHKLTAKKPNQPSAPTSNPPPPGADDAKSPHEKFIARYRDDPIDFVVYVLGGSPKKWQREFLKAIARGDRRISVRAGHGVGKSTACAWAAIWFMTTRYPQKTVVTAPSAGQLFDALFAEMKFWFKKLPEFLLALFDIKSEYIELRASPEGSFISARTASKERPEALAGIHSENVLLIADEAPGVPEEIFRSAAGSMSGANATTVLLGNPTRLSGLFFNTHHAIRDRWTTFHVSCTDPDLVGLVDPDFAADIAATYGVDSDEYRIRVLGDFPKSETNTLISTELVEAAIKRDIAPLPGAVLVYGLDVARFGDDRTVLVKRQGNVVIEVKAWSKLDLMQVVGVVMNEASIDRPAEICIDSIGLGAGAADRLREQAHIHKARVVDVNVAEASATNPKAYRLRDELWLSLKDWLGQLACKLPPDDELQREISAPLYSYSSTGKTVVESKEAMKRRGYRSPDKADALCLTFAGTAALIGGRSSTWAAGQPLKRNIRGVT